MDMFLSQLTGLEPLVQPGVIEMHKMYNSLNSIDSPFIYICFSLVACSILIDLGGKGHGN